MVIEVRMEQFLTLVQMTAAYSNAVLVAILPHFTHVARTLELPIPTPIVQSQVHHFFCDPRAGEVGGYVVLTNGYEFWFQHGYVSGMSSPWNVFRLQDPDLLPRFYGPLRMNEKEAVALARKTLTKLGYTNDVFDTVEPEVQLESPKESFAVNQGVPQYRIIWHDPDWHYSPPLNIAEVDVNANVKHVDAFQLYSKIFWRTNLNVGIVPKLLPKPKPQRQYVGGIKMKPFTPAYSNAFLRVVLPEITDFARRLDLPIQLPVSLQQCTNIDGGFVKDDPEVQIILTNTDRFIFEHGRVIGFYARDNYFFGNLLYGGRTIVKKAELYQSGPVSTNELIQIARQAIHKLGYSEKALHMEGPPDFITIPENTKTNFFTRYQIGWDFMRLPSGMEGYRVTIEVDAKTKSIKALYLDNTNIWRAPPKIDVQPEKTK